MSLGAQTTTVWRNLLPQWPHLRFRPKHNRSHQYSSGKNKKFLNSLYRATTAEHYRRQHSQSLKGNRNKILSLICAACSRFFTGNFYDRPKSEKSSSKPISQLTNVQRLQLAGSFFLISLSNRSSLGRLLRIINQTGDMRPLQDRSLRPTVAVIFQLTH